MTSQILEYSRKDVTVTSHEHHSCGVTSQIPSRHTTSVRRRPQVTIPLSGRQPMATSVRRRPQVTIQLPYQVLPGCQPLTTSVQRRIEVVWPPRLVHMPVVWGASIVLRSRTPIYLLVRRRSSVLNLGSQKRSRYLVLQWRIRGGRVDRVDHPPPPL